MILMVLRYPSKVPIMRVLLVTTVARKVSWGPGQTQTYCESVCRDRDKLETACP